MSKHVIIKNCPAYELMRNAASGTYFNICGNAKGHIKCCDIDDCIIKQIVELCKNEYKKPPYFISTGLIYYKDGSFLASEIFKKLEIEEVE